MKIKSTSISTIFFFFIVLSLSGTSQANLRCTISKTAKENCSPYLLLNEAEISLTEKGSFHLIGTYSACYHEDRVMMQGEVLRTSYPGGQSLELLATEIHHKYSAMVERFPRTIGIITLKESLLQGFFFDAWATIRTNGLFQPTPKQRVVSCVYSSE